MTVPVIATLPPPCANARALTRNKASEMRICKRRMGQSLLGNGSTECPALCRYILLAMGYVAGENGICSGLGVNRPAPRIYAHEWPFVNHHLGARRGIYSPHKANRISGTLARWDPFFWRVRFARAVDPHPPGKRVRRRPILYSDQRAIQTEEPAWDQWKPRAGPEVPKPPAPAA